ncbi:hypothetical protein CLM62_40605 [Streptomyces sp. SA15]|uniref:hypothetical protein n=1 Tax=Streptomyces sp. SA15 TaxID=934019 RepID=UPI000BAFD688|nr:hypothetical protein [Streptomyces sp. SA15]PAZ10470.1 hypothetical protein CLM62_40605 [Streptomyces sp. SA15]
MASKTVEAVLFPGIRRQGPFRSSGQNLTTAGTYIEMASRVTEPVLLGLAVLAVRNRVKR